MEMPVSQLMSPNPVALRPDDSVARALEEMERSGIRHLPVVDGEGRLAGLVSHRDLVSAEARARRKVAELMQEDVKTVGPATPAHEAAYLLLRHKIGCVPVTLEDGRLAGIVTAGDFVRIAYTLLGGRVDPDELAFEEEEARRV